MRRLNLWICLWSLACLWNPWGMQACATCFGRSDDAMAKGMNFGILSLMLIIGLVLTGIATFFVFIARKSVNASAAVDSENN